MDVFFRDEDYADYLHLLAPSCEQAGVAIWAYCLMPNHVHLILVPNDEIGLARALAKTHREYTRRVNRREEWTGHLWQDRFHSAAMDEAHLLAAARYVELNPVRAKLVRRPEAWRWSSAAAHLAGRDDGVVSVAPLLAAVDDWRNFLSGGLSAEEAEAIECASSSNWPRGSPTFINSLEKRLGIRVRPIRRRG